MNIKVSPQLKKSILNLKEKKYKDQDSAIKDALQDLANTLDLSDDEILKRAEVLKHAIEKKTFKVLKELEDECMKYLSYSQEAPLPSEVTELRFWHIPETVKMWETIYYLNDKILQETIHTKKTFWEILDLVLNKKKSELNEILTALVPDNQTALWEEWFNAQNIGCVILPTEKKVEEKADNSWDAQDSWKSSTTEDFDKDLLDFFAPKNSTDGGDLFPSVGSDAISREEGATNEWEEEDISKPGSAYNRIKYLKQILDERGVPFEYRLAIIWTNTPEMRREQSYVAIRIERLDRTVLINNSYGEATYVVTWILDIEDLTTFTKKDYQEDQNAVKVRFFSSNPGLWGSQMSEALFSPINNKLKNHIKKQEAELERDNMTGRVINDLENMKGLGGESEFESLSLEEKQAIIRRRLQEPENIKKWFKTTIESRNKSGTISELSWGVGLISLYKIFEVEVKYPGGNTGGKNFYFLSERIFWREYNTDIEGYQEPPELIQLRKRIEFLLLSPEEQQAVIRKRLQEPENMKKWFSIPPGERTRDKSITNISWGRGLEFLYDLFWFDTKSLEGITKDDNFYELSRRIFWKEYNTDIPGYQEPLELKELEEKANETAKRRAFDSLPPEEQQAIIRRRLQEPENMKRWFGTTSGNRATESIITNLSWGWGIESLYKIFWFDIKSLGGKTMDDNFYELSRRIFWAEYNTDIVGYQEPTAELEKLRKRAEEVTRQRAFDSLPLEEQRTIIRKKLQDSEARKKWFEPTAKTRYKNITELGLGRGLTGLYTLFEVDKEESGWATTDESFYKLSERIFWAEYNTDIVGYQEPTTELEELRKRAEKDAKRRAFESLPLEEQQTIIRRRLQEPENMKKWFGTTSGNRNTGGIITEISWVMGLESLCSLFDVGGEQLDWAYSDEIFYELSKKIFLAEYNTNIVGYQEPTAELEELRRKAEEAAKRRVFESLPLEEQQASIRHKLQDSEVRKKWFGSITNTRYKTITDLDLGKGLVGLYTLFEVDKEQLGWAHTDESFYELSKRIFWAEYNTDIPGYQEPTAELEELRKKAEKAAKRRIKK